MNLKEILELIYFISGPVLALIAFLALNQIKIAKEQLKATREISETQSRRDALRATSEQVHHYSCDVIPLISALDAKVKSEGITYFEDSKVIIENESIKVEPRMKEDDAEKMPNIGHEMVAACNAIEGFAIYFTSGVADEKTAYTSLSTTYCNTV